MILSITFCEFVKRIPRVLSQYREKHGCIQCCSTDLLIYLLKAIIVLVYTEPNLLSGTAHSVNKRGVKRRDLDVEELKEILSPLLPFVRTEHILPANSDVLSDVVSTHSLFLSRCVLES